MISFSIWHCDYCLGDICCCIKSNLPFLSSIVSTWELFSFFKVGGDNLKKHPSKEARLSPQPGVPSENAQTHPSDGFCPLQDLQADRLPAFTAGEKALSPCVHLHAQNVALLGSAVGLPTLPALVARLFSLSLWHPVTGIAWTAYSWVSVPASACCHNATSKQNMSLSSMQVKRPFSRLLHQRADGGFRLRIKSLILWGADLNRGWGQHSAPCKDRI